MRQLRTELHYDFFELQVTDHAFDWEETWPLTVTPESILRSSHIGSMPQQLIKCHDRRRSRAAVVLLTFRTTALNNSIAFSKNLADHSSLCTILRSKAAEQLSKYQSKRGMR